MKKRKIYSDDLTARVHSHFVANTKSLSMKSVLMKNKGVFLTKIYFWPLSARGTGHKIPKNEHHMIKIIGLRQNGNAPGPSNMVLAMPDRM